MAAKISPQLMQGMLGYLPTDNAERHSDSPEMQGDHSIQWWLENKKMYAI